MNRFIGITQEELFHLKSGLRDIPSGLIALYLYGSILKGRLRGDSDIDIAMLADHRIAPEERLRLIAEVEAIFGKLLRAMGFSQDISVLDMRAPYVSIELLYKIIIEGLCIYERSHDERLEYEATVKAEYFDFMPFIMALRKKRYGIDYQKA